MDFSWGNSELEIGENGWSPKSWHTFHILNRLRVFDLLLGNRFFKLLNPAIIFIFQRHYIAQIHQLILKMTLWVSIQFTLKKFVRLFNYYPTVLQNWFWPTYRQTVFEIVIGFVFIDQKWRGVWRVFKPVWEFFNEIEEFEAKKKRLKIFFLEIIF